MKMMYRTFAMANWKRASQCFSQIVSGLYGGSEGGQSPSTSGSNGGGKGASRPVRVRSVDERSLDRSNLGAVIKEIDNNGRLRFRAARRPMAPFDDYVSSSHVVNRLRSRYKISLRLEISSHQDLSLRYIWRDNLCHRYEHFVECLN